MTEENFFTTITNPKDFRKNLLESSKQIIQILKDHQTVLDLRKEKEGRKAELNKQFEELNVLIEKLDSFLPEDSMKQLEKLMPQKKVHKPIVHYEPEVIEEIEVPRRARKRRKKTSTPVRKESDSELDRLEIELEEIEKKLSRV